LEELQFDRITRFITNWRRESSTILLPKEERQQVTSDYKELQRDLQLLVEVARKIREGRLKRGALELESSELRFQLNSDRDPVNIIPKKEQGNQPCYC